MRIPRSLFVMFRWLAIGVIALAVIVGGYYLFEYWRGARDWRRVVAASQAKGESLDVLPEPSSLPAESNFARTPVLDQWLFGSADDPAFSAFLARTHLDLKELKFADRSSDEGWPEFAWVDCARTADGWFAAEQGGTQTGVALSARRLLTLMGPMDPVLEELRQAALIRPESELTRPEAIPTENPFQCVVVRFRFARGVILALAAHGSAALAEKRHDVAFADTLAGVKLARAFLSMPDATLVESMVGVVLIRIALQPLWEGCQIHEWTDAELEQFQGELALLRPAESFSSALRVERACAVLTLEHASFGAFTKPSWNWVKVPRGWLLSSQAFYCQSIDDALAVVDSAGTGGFLRARTERKARLVARFDGVRSWEALRLAAGMMAVPSVWKPIDHSVRAAAFVALARTACALERFRNANGAYPESLALLVPEYLSSVPLDVIDGQPLRFVRPRRATYVLYSVGLNGVDDGGYPEKWKTPEGAVSDDWCWVQLAE